MNCYKFIESFVYKVSLPKSAENLREVPLYNVSIDLIIQS